MAALRPAVSRSSRPRSRPSCRRPLLPRMSACSDAAFGWPAPGSAQQFGRELRGADLMSLWHDADRDASLFLLHTVLSRWRGRPWPFTPIPPPSGTPASNSSAAADPHRRRDQSHSRRDHRDRRPFWLGAEPLVRQEIIELNLHSPTAPRRSWPKAARRSSACPAGAFACLSGVSARRLTLPAPIRTHTDNYHFGQGLDVLNRNRLHCAGELH